MRARGNRQFRRRFERSSVSSTKSVCIELLTPQRTMRRAKTSMTKATYSRPSEVETEVKSETRSWFGRSALNRLFILFQRTRGLRVPDHGAYDLAVDHAARALAAHQSVGRAADTARPSQWGCRQTSPAP